MLSRKKTKNTSSTSGNNAPQEPGDWRPILALLKTPELACMIFWMCSPATLARLAQVHSFFKELALKVLWECPSDEAALFMLLPERVVEIQGRNVIFKDVPYSESDWVVFSQYAPRVRGWEPEKRVTLHSTEFWMRVPSSSRAPILARPRPTRIRINIRDGDDTILLLILLNRSVIAVDIVSHLNRQHPQLALLRRVLSRLPPLNPPLRHFKATGIFDGIGLSAEVQSWLAQRPTLKEFAWTIEKPVAMNARPASLASAVIPLGRGEDCYPVLETFRIDSNFAARVLETSVGSRLRELALKSCDVEGVMTMLDLVGRKCHGIINFQLTIESCHHIQPTATGLPVHRLFGISTIKNLQVRDHGRLFPPPTEGTLLSSVAAWPDIETFEWITGVAERQPGTFALPSINAIHLFSGCKNLHKLLIPVDTRLPLKIPISGPRFHRDFVLFVDETEWIAADRLSIDKMIVYFDAVHPFGRHGARQPLGWMTRVRDSKRTKRIMLKKEVWAEVVSHAGACAKTPTHRVKRIAAAQQATTSS